MNYFYKTNLWRVFVCLPFLLGAITISSYAQTTITTETGTGYTGSTGIVGGNTTILFVIDNTNATPITLTQVDCQWATFFTSGSTTPSLWYSATSLSGPPTIAAPAWTKIVTAPAMNITADGILPTFTGLSFVIPANTQYRFAVESTNGIAYSPATATPTIFSANGVNLKVSNQQIAGANVGYGGAMPSPINNPRAFTGRIKFTIGGGTPCTGTPAPGNTVSSANPVCAGTTFNLTPQNATSGTGVTYQWQSSLNGTTYTDVPGATSATYGATQTQSTYYQLRVSCGANTATTTPLLVTNNLPTNCYCTAGATSTSFEKIGRVQFNTIDNASTSTAGYENFTAISTNVQQGSTYPITVTITGGFADDRVMVWIDFNQDGDFTDAGELVYTSATGAGPHTGNITIPAGALQGTTRMRIRMFDSVLGPNITPCGTSTYGQVEDYSIGIFSCIPPNVTGQPTAVSTTCGANAVYTVSGSGFTSIQWQVSSNGGATWTPITNGAQYTGTTGTTLTVIGVGSTLQGNLYRAVFTNSCGPINSNSASLTVATPPTPTVTPTSVVACIGGLVPLTITTAGGAATTVVSSGPISVPIPDNNLAGNTHTLAVNTIPAGAVITGIIVTINMNHTWVGDMIIALRAPNGNILNLDYMLTNTGGAAATSGFTNTRISSTGTAPLSSGTSPYNAVFRADAISTGASGIGGPTGFAPNVTTFAGLYSVPNGNWTLAFRDAFNLDAGALTSWSLTFTYGSPLSGNFSPFTNLFVDAAGTIPYTGESLNTVYVKGATNTSYNVTLGVPGCMSAPRVVPVTVNTPASFPTQPIAAVACEKGSATFSGVATGTGPISYQWQVSSDGGVTWTNITGANNASFTVSDLTPNQNNFRYRLAATAAAPCGPTFSNAAVLTVRPLPIVSISANPTTRLIPTTTTTLTANVNGAAAASFRWFRNGTQVTGATGSTLLVNIDQLGDYTAMVTDVNGCVSLISPSLTIGDSATSKVFIYPNPNRGKFHVRYFSEYFQDPAAAGGRNPNLVRYISVYNSLGQGFIDKPFSVNASYGSMDVDVTAWNKGIFWIEIKDVAGRRLVTAKVVVL